MNWTLETIGELLAKNDDWSVSTETNCLIISNPEGVEVFLTVCGEQIIAESLLVEVDLISDKNALNEEILKTHKLFPLTTVGIVSIESVEYYAAFGALSSQSKAESIELEVEFLFQNVEGMIEAYAGYIR